MANDNLKLLEVAVRIREMREILEWSTITMAQKTGVTVEEYETYESGKVEKFLPIKKQKNAPITVEL